MGLIVSLKSTCDIWENMQHCHLLILTCVVGGLPSRAPQVWRTPCEMNITRCDSCKCTGHLLGRLLAQVSFSLASKAWRGGGGGVNVKVWLGVGGVTYTLKPIFHWKLGLRWVPNADEIYTKKHEMYMANAKVLRLVPNATYIPLTCVEVTRNFFVA